MDTKLKPKRTLPFKTFLVPVLFPLVTMFEIAGTKNGCGLTPPTLRIRGMRYYYATHTSIHIYILEMCSVSTVMASKLASQLRNDLILVDRLL